jgi:heavy metal efflux system protein
MITDGTALVSRNPQPGLLHRIVTLSIANRCLVLIIVLALCALGAWAARHLPIDAVPDITNVQVQINTEVPGMTPLEVENRITFQVETAMAGLPNLQYTRSLSRYGLSQVTVIFRDGTDIYFARQLISERLSEVSNEMPAGIKPAMGPIATGLGEIFMYVLEPAKDTQGQPMNKPDGSPYTLAELRAAHDWVVKPQLRTLPGVIEVNTIGGDVRQIQITPDLARMAARGVRMDDIAGAVEKSNQSIGAGFIERNGEQYLVRLPAQMRELNELAMLVITERGGRPIRLSDVARVEEGRELRTGAATMDGREVVLGTVFMLMGSNSREVAKAVSVRLQEIQKSLPKSLSVHVVYDRTALVDRTIATVQKNLLEGAALVVVVLLLLLGNFRAALITAAIIPIVMLLSAIGMWKGKISANLMSLGALDFGLIVDGAVIVVENCLRQLAHAQASLGRALNTDERLAVCADASSAVMRPALFGVGIITAVYLPILTLTGVEGKMFVPMALVVVIALVFAMILSLTLVPAAVALFMREKVSEHESWLMLSLARLYRPLLAISLRAPVAFIVGAVILITGATLLALRLGSEFLPSLDEGDIAMHALRIPGTSLSQSVGMQTQLESRLRAFPEVALVLSKIGTADIATDPMPPSVADTYVMLKERKQWPNPRKTRRQLTLEIAAAMAKIPGNNYEYTQPIEMRFNELISGVRSEIAVKVYGDDMDKLLEQAHAVSEVLENIPGAQSVNVEQITGLPVLSITPKNEALARLGITGADVQDLISTLLGGRTVGQWIEGDRRFDIVIRADERTRADLQTLRQLQVPLPDHPEGESGASKMRFVPLDQIADIAISTGPNQINREQGKRRVVVTANVEDDDLGGFVRQLQEKVDRDVKLQPGYWLEYAGTFKQLESANARLMVVVPITLLLIFALLVMALGSAREAALVYTGIPLALTGGVLALVLRDIPFSISAAVGFIALSGIAVLNGLVLMSAMKERLQAGSALLDAIREGAQSRLRPVVMTALVAGLGFVPMAFNVGAGSEVQRPLATVVIGGVVTATLLTLLVLPALYSLFGSKQFKTDLTK